MKTLWIIFLRDEDSGVIHGYVNAHNVIADWKRRPEYIGYQEIEVDVEKMEKEK